MDVFSRDSDYKGEYLKCPGKQREGVKGSNNEVRVIEVLGTLVSNLARKLVVQKVKYSKQNSKRVARNLCSQKMCNHC